VPHVTCHVDVAKVILKKSSYNKARALLRTIGALSLHYFSYGEFLMVSAVVLAAGASTRMGTQKLLLPFGHEPLVRRAVRLVCDAGFDEVLVVLGSDHEATLAALEGLPIRHVVNTQFASGMGSSFRTAVEHLPDSTAAMFALADQPFVTTQEYRTVLDTYRQHGPAIVSVRYGEVMAPPHLFERELFPELAQLTHGARSVLQRHVERTIVLQFPPDLLVDIDTPDDYELARSRLSSGR
jgi:molybdenum cofactor cytidylyltransferase